MRPILNSIRILILIAMAAIVVSSPAAHAQQPTTTPVADGQQAAPPADADAGNGGGFEKTSAEIDQVRKKLAALQESIKQNAADDNQLVTLAGKVDDLNGRVTAISDRLKPRAADVTTRLTQLGAAPKEGQPPEAAIVSQEREKLTAQLAQINVVIGDADNLAAATTRTSADAIELRRKLFAETLFKRTELSPSTFDDAGRAFVQETVNFSNAVISWTTFVWKFKRLSLFSVIVLSLVAALVFLAGSYRLFGPYLKRDEGIDEPSYINRLTFAFWSTMIRTMAFAAFLLVSYFFLDSMNVLRADIAPVLSALLGFIWLVYFVARVVNAVFAPLNPRWRLVKLSNRGAHSIGWCVLTVAVVNGLDFVLNRVSESMGSPVIVTVAKSFLASFIIGLIFIAVSFGKPILAKNGDPDAPGRRWKHGMAIILRVIGIALIFAALAGYVGLARFIALQLVITSAVIVTMYLGILLGKAVSDQESFPDTIAGRFLQHKAKLSGAMLDQAGLVVGLAIYAFALVTGIPLILLSWGFHTQDLETLAYRMFTGIKLGSINISLVGIFAGILFFVGGYFVTRWFQRWLDSNVMARGQVDLGVRNSVKTGIGYLGVAIAAVIGISAAGIDLSSLALVASALSVGIGFGLQNIVSNFVSGLILLVERPFKVGDWIVSGTSEGIVKRISVRATEIETFRKQSIIVPNSELINASVGNWTHRNRLARSEIPISVGYDSDPQQVMDILLELVQAVPKVLRNPEPHVEFLRFGPSSLDFEMRFYLADLSDGMPIRNNLRIAILQRFKDAGIQIPHPQQQLHINCGPIQAVPDVAVPHVADEEATVEAEVVPEEHPVVSAPESPARNRGRKKP